MSTATKPPAIRDVSEIQQDCQSILSELRGEFLERGEHLLALFITMLSAQHAFLLGPPGTGKSAMVRALCARFAGAIYWEILMDRQLGKEESFGPIDIALYDTTGKWVRNISGTLADCHIAFVDEAGKAGPASLNPYLTAFNERTFKANGKPEAIPLISAIGASNEMLEPELAAMWDRFLVRKRVDYLVEPGNFTALLASAVQKPVATTPTTISLEEFKHVVEDVVPAIKVPPGINESMQKMRVELASLGNHPSDRRWKQAVRLLQASAWLGGNDTVDDDDLAILTDVLWDTEAQIPDVEKIVLSSTSPITKAALTMQSELTEINQGVSDRIGQALTARTDYGAEAQYKLNELLAELNRVVEDANRQGRSTLKLEAVRDQIRSTRQRVYQECMNLDEAAAERAAASTP